MGADKARVSYDPMRHYRTVVMQQGRVTLEADWNENQTIFSEELRKETLEIVGPAATPDDGYQVMPPIPPDAAPDDFSVSAGTMYVGGVRVQLDIPVNYSTQPDWLDHSLDPDWVDPSQLDGGPTDEYVYLFLREQEVSAVEDRVLREVALGGPDTAARTRIIQHIVRRETETTDCAGGLAAAISGWANEGLVFDSKTMRLVPQSNLKVSFGNLPPPDPCEPEVVGGYLGADNQLIRVQINGQNTIVWGFDDASFMYRINIDPAGQILTLQSQPVDAFHQPQANQAVEVLRDAAGLGNGDYVASPTGVVQTLTSSYNQSTQQLTLPAPLPAQYLDPAQTPQAFLRVWQQQLTFVPGTAIELGTTGIFVTINSVAGAPFHVGDFWMFAVRPSTPTQVYPYRYIDPAQPAQFPDGPRMWACGLAAIEWDAGVLKVDQDCRVQFCNLIEACNEKGSGCCTVTATPQDAANLQSIIDGSINANGDAVTICLAPGTYNLPRSLTLGSQHSNFTIEGCGDGAIIQAARGSETNFLQGLIVLNQTANTTLRGLRFRMPLVQFTAAKGIFAGLDSAVLDKLIKLDPKLISVSIGVRPLECANLTIEDCSFDFPEAIEIADRDVFGAAIFAASRCAGLTLENNRFQRTVREKRRGLFRMLIGFLLAPTVTIELLEGAAERLQGTVLPSFLSDALIRDNTFVQLTAPALIYADCAEVRIEDNAVQGCYAGFWMVALQFLGLWDLLLALIPDEISLIGSTIADAYPLPADFTSSPINVPALSSSRVPPPNLPPPLPGLLALRDMLSTLERSALANQVQAVSLIFSHNEILAAQANFTGITAFGISATGLMIIDTIPIKSDGQGITSSIMLSSNRILNSSASYPTAMIIAGAECSATVTGNEVLNLGATAGNAVPSSLVFVPIVTGPVAAITGNVFKGHATLAPRNSPPAAPLDNWDVFNTEV
jgi:hypothetical protein